MKRTLILLAVAILLVNSVGCCRGLRDWCYQGAYCGPSAAVRGPVFAAAPSRAVPVFQHCATQPVAVPQPQYAVAVPQPQYAVAVPQPQYAVAVPQPQYAVAAPTSMVCGSAGCGGPYMTEMGCGVPYMTEMGCNYSYGGGMIMPSPQLMYPGPAIE